jgi:nitrogen fixation-related uncharacterized protein
MNNTTAIDSLINKVATNIVNPIILLLFSVAFLIFLWGLFQFIYQADDATAREDGKKHMLYGVIGLAIMVGAIGIVQILKRTVANI